MVGEATGNEAIDLCIHKHYYCLNKQWSVLGIGMIETGCYSAVVAVLSVGCRSPSIVTSSFTASLNQMSTGMTTAGEGRSGNTWRKGGREGEEKKLRVE